MTLPAARTACCGWAKTFSPRPRRVRSLLTVELMVTDYETFASTTDHRPDHPDAEPSPTGI
jgi:hypothetical protein